MDAQTVKLHPSVLLTPTWKGPYLASSLLNTPSPDGYLLPVSLRLLLRLCCLDNLCPLLCLHYDSGSLFSDKLLGTIYQASLHTGQRWPLCSSSITSRGASRSQ